MKKWEYNKTHGELSQSYLDHMGDQGWELVDFRSTTAAGYDMIWKREKVVSENPKSNTRLDRLTKKLDCHKKKRMVPIHLLERPPANDQLDPGD